MKEKVIQEPTGIAFRYTAKDGLSCSEIKKLTVKEAIWVIDYLANDSRTHILWEDCAKWLETKMKEIRKLTKHLKKTRPMLLEMCKNKQ
jgi:hypothetical protein